MKKLSRIFLATAMLAGGAAALTGCDVKAAEYKPGEAVKVGLICLHDETSTYDNNFIKEMANAATAMGNKMAEPIIKTGVGENKECFNAAKELVKQGCNVIFADSFGHEEFMLKAAKKWPQVQFCHATGTQAKTAGVANYHNAFASIYEGRYLAGYAAGLKLQKMVADNQITNAQKDADGNIKLGYVGAYPYAEVVSGYTSWFLGVREVVNNVVMSVTYTKEWYHVDKEQNGANSLISGGAALISQHADSMGAPNACQAANVPNVSYNMLTGLSTNIAYSRINWAPYYEEVVNKVYEGKANELAANWTGTLDTGSVEYDVLDATDKATVQGIEAELKAGTRKVFDCDKFTVAGAKVTTYKADVDDYGDFVKETEAIKSEGGKTFFDESALRSAPYFDLRIDGITELE